MYAATLLTLSAALVHAYSDTDYYDPYDYATSTVACTTQLSQSDVDISDENPCPQFFQPLPTQGALSGTQLTLFGFPGYNDYSGSVITSDGTSTTYAFTCASSDYDDYDSFGLCTAPGVVVPITASGWNWHFTTSSIDSYTYFNTWTDIESITCTMDSLGHFSADYYYTQVAAHTTPESSSYNYVGTVAVDVPMVVPITGGGLTGVAAPTTQGQVVPTSTMKITNRPGSTGLRATGQASRSLTYFPSMPSGSSTVSTSTYAGGATSRTSFTKSVLGDRVWMSLGMSSMLVASLAVLL